MKFSLDDIIKATNAKILKSNMVDDLRFTFSTDTRTIQQGEIYLPLKGENFDGEKFIDKALESGAIGYFCTDEQIIESAKIILQVENSLIAYLQLARFYKRKIVPKTVAITGSSGKTTTKEMAFSVASEKFKTHKSELNFNNEIGLCKTILSMPEDTQVLILEMGMRGPGEIELLSEYSEPDIAIIANVGTAHVGRLGSKENISKAKCEVIKHMKKDGILIAHDNNLIKNEIKNYEINSLYFSLNDAQIKERKIGYSKFQHKNYQYELNIEGDYNIQNALSVIEMGLLLGMQEEEIASGLKKYSPIEKRWEIQELSGYKVINDSYNANPDSMQAVIKTVLDVYLPPLLFVLGNMGELGEDEEKYHKNIGDFLVNNYKEGIEIITVGKLAQKITSVLSEKGIYSKNFSDNIKTALYILDNVKIGTTIILKASRSMKFEEIIETIKKGRA